MNPEMNSLFEQSKQRITFHYQLHENTILVLNENLCQWIAKVTTKHLTERGEPEVEFTVLVQLFDFMMLGEEAIAPLAQWCEEYK